MGRLALDFVPFSRFGALAPQKDQQVLQWGAAKPSVDSGLTTVNRAHLLSDTPKKVWKLYLNNLSISRFILLPAHRRRGLNP